MSSPLTEKFSSTTKRKLNKSEQNLRYESMNTQIELKKYIESHIEKISLTVRCELPETAHSRRLWTKNNF